MPNDEDAKTQKYAKYHLPQRPADLNADEMTIQETAYVLKISVGHARRIFRAAGLFSKPGRRVVTTRAEREAILAASHAGGRPGRRTKRRRSTAATNTAARAA